MVIPETLTPETPSLDLAAIQAAIQAAAQPVQQVQPTQPVQPLPIHQFNERLLTWDVLSVWVADGTTQTKKHDTTNQSIQTEQDDYERYTRYNSNCNTLQTIKLVE